MATSKNIKDADLALQGLDVRLGELLDKALTNTEMLTNSFAKMKDAVPKDVFDHVNGQMDKTKEIAQEITDIESLRGTSAFESAKSQFSIDTKIADSLTALGPDSNSYLSTNVASTWFDVSVFTEYSASPAAVTTIKFQSNYLGELAAPSISSGTVTTYNINNTYFELFGDIEGTGFTTIPEGIIWGKLFHNGEKSTLVFVNKSNKLIFSFKAV